MATERITTVISDLADVLVSGCVGLGRLVQEEVGISAKQFERVREETREVFRQTMRGMLSEEQYLNFLIRKGGWRIDSGQLGELFRRNFERPFEQSALGVMRLLKEREYRMVLLSDHVEAWVVHVLGVWPELRMFGWQFFSYDFGLLKSERWIFDKVLGELAVRPEECLFVDDQWPNVLAARKCGVQGILYRDPGHLVGELAKYGITV